MTWKRNLYQKGESANTDIYNDDINDECGRIKTPECERAEEGNSALVEFSHDYESENRSIEELSEPPNSFSRISGSEKLPNASPKEEYRSVSSDLPQYGDTDPQSSSSSNWTYDSKSISRQTSYFDDIDRRSRSSAPFELSDQGRPASVEPMREIMFGSALASNTHSFKGNVDNNRDNDNEFEVESKLPCQSKDFRLESTRQPSMLPDLMFSRSIQDTSIPKRPVSFIEIGNNIMQSMAVAAVSSVGAASGTIAGAAVAAGTVAGATTATTTTMVRDHPISNYVVSVIKK
jgi:hypothetical protein